MTGDLLSQLRDIHYPPAISIWPLAIGWYFLIAMLCILLAVTLTVLIRRWRQQVVKRLVLARLDELEAMQNAQHHSISEELSMLLKRAALARYPRREVAGLYGQAWLEFLNKTALTTEFTQDVGQLLVVSPYMRQSDTIPMELFHLIRTWVKKNL